MNHVILFGATYIDLSLISIYIQRRPHKKIPVWYREGNKHDCAYTCSPVSLFWSGNSIWSMSSNILRIVDDEWSTWLSYCINCIPLYIYEIVIFVEHWNRSWSDQQECLECPKIRWWVSSEETRPHRNFKDSVL